MYKMFCVNNPLHLLQKKKKNTSNDINHLNFILILLTEIILPNILFCGCSFSQSCYGKELKQNSAQAG